MRLIRWRERAFGTRDAAGGTQRSALNKFFNIEESVVTSGSDFVSPKARHLYEWWRTANGGRLPSKRQFDITEHKEIVPNLFLTEVTPAGEFVFRLFGEEVIQMIGRNSRGEKVKSSAMGEYGHALDEYYRSIVRQKLSKRCIGSLAFADKDFRRFESVDCPLAGDGEQVAHIIGVMDWVD